MVASLTIPAKLSNLSAIRSFVTQTACKFCCDENFIYDLELAVDEAVTNIINHGYSQMKKKRRAFVRIDIQPLPDGLAVIIQDQAPVFDPTRYPPPDLHQPLEQRRPGGMGIYLMHEMTDALEHEPASGGGNILRMLKKFPEK